ncbi:MAG TPA: hypothetical protein VK468_07660, partial [Pyrinomonadaceae bacterium]|nr:hypothetical protein [Pyrinomonadaceae bacterium]
AITSNGPGRRAMPPASPFKIEEGNVSHTVSLRSRQLRGVTGNEDDLFLFRCACFLPFGKIFIYRMTTNV